MCVKSVFKLKNKKYNTVFLEQIYYYLNRRYNVYFAGILIKAQSYGLNLLFYFYNIYSVDLLPSFIILDKGIQ